MDAWRSKDLQPEQALRSKPSERAAALSAESAARDWALPLIPGKSDDEAQNDPSRPQQRSGHGVLAKQRLRLGLEIGAAALLDVVDYLHGLIGVAGLEVEPGEVQ